MNWLGIRKEINKEYQTLYTYHHVVNLLEKRTYPPSPVNYTSVYILMCQFNATFVFFIARTITHIQNIYYGIFVNELF